MPAAFFEEPVLALVVGIDCSSSIGHCRWPALLPAGFRVPLGDLPAIRQIELIPRRITSWTQP